MTTAQSPRAAPTPSIPVYDRNGVYVCEYDSKDPRCYGMQVYNFNCAFAFATTRPTRRQLAAPSHAVLTMLMQTWSSQGPWVYEAMK